MPSTPECVVTGIGSLLLDGLGDTIRVSLTEDPELEIEPCTRLANLGTRAMSEVGLLLHLESPSTLAAIPSVPAPSIRTDLVASCVLFLQ